MAEYRAGVPLRGARTIAKLTVGLLACGPAKGDGDGSASGGGASADATSASVASDEGFTTMSSSSWGASADASSTGTPVACPDNVANEPFCYRKFAIPSNGELGDGPTDLERAQPARAGHFGPDGELAFLLSGEDAGTPMALAFWNGDGFDVQPWGVVPSLDNRRGRWPVRMFDGLHSDLIVGSRTMDRTLAIAPWTLDGPGEPVVVEQLGQSEIISLFHAQTVIDVNRDGFDEIAVYVQPFVHRLVGNVDGVPSFFGDEITHHGECGGGAAGIGAGDFDGDGLVDLAAIGQCEVRNLGGVFAFAAEWGDGAGRFASEGVMFSATSPSAWLGVADFDGDGFDDVLTATEDGSTYYESYLYFHRSRGDRTFAAPLKFWTELDPPRTMVPPPTGPTVAPDAFVFGDVDGDGIDDVVFQGFMLAAVQVAGDKQYLEMFDIAWDRYERQVISAFDLNEDGRLDFLVWDADEGAYALMSSA